MSAIKSRFTNFIAYPADLLVSVGHTATDLVTGLAYTALSIVTLGQISTINEIADNSLENLHENNLITQLFKNTFTLANPDSKFAKIDKGLVYYFTVKKLYEKAANYASQESFLKRHIFSRFAYLTAAVAAVAARVVDFVHGIIALAVSGGKSSNVNTIICAHFNIFSTFQDLGKGIRGFINPKQFD